MSGVPVALSPTRPLLLRNIRSFHGLVNPIFGSFLLILPPRWVAYQNARAIHFVPHSSCSSLAHVLSEWLRWLILHIFNCACISGRYCTIENYGQGCTGIIGNQHVPQHLMSISMITLWSTIHISVPVDCMSRLAYLMYSAITCIYAHFPNTTYSTADIKHTPTILRYHVSRFDLYH